MQNENEKSQDFNVSSLVVMCKGEDIQRLWEEIEKIPQTQCHYKDESGKIIVTIESSNVDEEIRTLKKIERLKGVISAQMIYTYHNSELEVLQENIQRQDAVPEILKNDNLKAEEIGYSGDVQDKIDNILNKKRTK